MSECLICMTSFEKVKPIELRCSCKQCSYCLTSWILSEVQEMSYQMKKKINCMNDECKQPFQISDVVDQLSEDQRSMINDALLQAYLKEAPDIRKCPQKGCNYAGIINIITPCDDKLECLKCGMKWIDKSQLSYEQSSYLSILGKANYNLITNQLWEIFFTKECPQCGVSIQKDGGCSHMTCRKCANSFCWSCLQKLDTHNERICLSSRVVKLFLIFFLLLHILCSFNLFHLLYWGVAKALQLLIIQTGATAGLFTFKLGKYLPVQNDWKVFGGSCAIFLTCLLIVYSFEFMTMMFVILLCEGIIMGIVAIYDHTHRKLGINGFTNEF